MNYRVETRDKDEDFYLDDNEYSNELDASKRARDLYSRGVYSVRVIKPDGQESEMWAKPEMETK